MGSRCLCAATEDHRASFTKLHEVSNKLVRDQDQAAHWLWGCNKTYHQLGNGANWTLTRNHCAGNLRGPSSTSAFAYLREADGVEGIFDVSACSPPQLSASTACGPNRKALRP